MIAPRYDLRLERAPGIPPKKVKLAGGRAVVRDPGDVDTLCLHQTACTFGVSAQQLRAAGGDRDLALARRSLAIACHVVAYRRGFFAACAPLRWWVQGGNGWNPRAIHLEIEGLYHGVEGDPRTVWSGQVPSVLTRETIAAARGAVAWIVEECAHEGMRIKRVVAHRQSSRSRRSDPGEAIWTEVGLWAQRELGLVCAPAEVLGEGRPIPLAWDREQGVGPY